MFCYDYTVMTSLFPTSFT